MQYIPHYVKSKGFLQKIHTLVKTKHRQSHRPGEKHISISNQGGFDARQSTSLPHQYPADGDEEALRWPDEGCLGY